MKYIFVNPISYNINPAPTIGIPELLGVLEKENIENEFVDLNLEYLNKLLDEKELKVYINFFDYLIKNQKYGQYKNFKEKYLTIRNTFYQISKRVNFCTYILKNKPFFYSPILISYADQILLYLSDYIGLIYDCVLEHIIPDAHTYRSKSENPQFYLNIEKIIDFFESDFNPLKDFYEKQVNKIIKKKADCIGITINITTQILSGLYLGYLLKKKTKAHINIGGSFFNDYNKLITNLKDCFGIFFDTISINDNTLTVLKLSQYINNQLDISNVDNLIYLESSTIKRNNIIKNNNYSSIPFQSFNGYSNNDYLSPELVLPIRASISCYWGKCIFCFCSNNSNFQIRSVENVINEIQFLSKKYKTKYFYFWDNSLPPEFLDKLTDKLLEKKIEIYYSVYARFELGFTKKLLKKMKQSGCLKILWGLDSASTNVLNYIQKGININEVPNILKNSYSVGISNTVHLILGHPSEKLEDLELDYSFIHKNKKYIDLLNIGYQLFYFEGAIITENRGKYKKLISIPEEELIYYKNKILNDAKLAKYAIYSVGIYNILYLKKYKASFLRFYRRFHLYISSNEKLFILYIKIHIYIYTIICKFQNKNKSKTRKKNKYE